VIDPVTATTNSAPATAAVTSPPEPDPATARAQPQPAAAGQTEVQTAERRQEAPPPSPTFDVRLDTRTLKLYSELRDPATDRVLLRIPDYIPADKKGGTGDGLETLV
jgi:hypothetical protein